MKEIFIESNGMYSEKTMVALDRINKLVECLEKKVLNDDEKTFISVQ